MFNWIRSKVKNAVLAGLSDAVDTLKSAHGADGADDAEQRLTALLAHREAPTTVVLDGKSRSARNGAKS